MHPIVLDLGEAWERILHIDPPLNELVKLRILLGKERLWIGKVLPGKTAADVSRVELDKGSYTSHWMFINLGHRKLEESRKEEGKEGVEGELGARNLGKLATRFGLFPPTPTMPAFPKLVAFDLDYTVRLYCTVSISRISSSDLLPSPTALGPVFVLSLSSDSSVSSSLTSPPLSRLCSLQGSTPTYPHPSNATVRS